MLLVCKVLYLASLSMPPAGVFLPVWEEVPERRTRETNCFSTSFARAERSILRRILPRELELSSFRGGKLKGLLSYSRSLTTSLKFTEFSEKSPFLASPHGGGGSRQADGEGLPGYQKIPQFLRSASPASPLSHASRASSPVGRALERHTTEASRLWGRCQRS